jgi:hypothetical protein
LALFGIEIGCSSSADDMSVLLYEYIFRFEQSIIMIERYLTNVVFRHPRGLFVLSSFSVATVVCLQSIDLACKLRIFIIGEH